MGLGRISRRRDLVRSAGCLLLALAVAACHSGAGRVSGVVIAVPACPVPSGAPFPACTPQPLSDLPLTVVRVSDATVAGQTPTSAAGLTVAQATTDSTGSFSFALDPGRYYVFGAGIFGLTAPSPAFFDVTAGSTASLTIRYGTGIR